MTPNPLPPGQPRDWIKQIIRLSWACVRVWWTKRPKK